MTTKNPNLLDYDDRNYHTQYSNISLRDLAALAYVLSKGQSISGAELAEYSFEFADKFIAERNKKKDEA